MLLVLHIQVLECGDEGLSLEASGGSRGNRRVADGALGADGGDVAPQRRPEVTGLISGLSHTADMEPTAEVDTVQDLEDTTCTYIHISRIYTKTHTQHTHTHMLTHSPCG